MVIVLVPECIWVIHRGLWYYLRGLILKLSPKGRFTIGSGTDGASVIFVWFIKGDSGSSTTPLC
jgi:hypothetical protein